jgi:uncharacterized protein (DUF885 family)
VKSRIDQLRTDLGYPLTEHGRKQIMADIDALIAEAQRRSSLQFDRRPQGPVIAQPYPRFREANAAASYTSPPLDGSRPAIFQMPLRPERMTKFGLRTLVHHETVPGHHFQIALMVEDRSLPPFRQARVFGGTSAITEGWALYAERLAAESGWYADDPEGLLGQMDAELFRARRLVVDTGLHAKRWTRQQAIDYGIEASEVERYVVNPGQACAYMIGQLKILELRDRARTTLQRPIQRARVPQRSARARNSSARTARTGSESLYSRGQQLVEVRQNWRDGLARCNRLQQERHHAHRQVSP